MFDKYKNMTRCPICNREMKVYSYIKDGWEVECKNYCFRFNGVNSVPEYFGIVFNKEYEFWGDEKDVWGAILKNMELDIKYWKENDRYLMKLLESDEDDALFR